MHFFLQKVDDRQNKTNKAVRYGNIFIFCLHYYRSKALRWARQGGARA